MGPLGPQTESQKYYEVIIKYSPVMQFHLPLLSHHYHIISSVSCRESTKSVADLKESQSPPTLYSSHIFSDYASGQPEQGKKKIRERTSIYSSPAGRYVTGPERCSSNIKMHLFTLPWSLIKNDCDHWSVAGSLSRRCSHSHSVREDYLCLRRPSFLPPSLPPNLPPSVFTDYITAVAVAPIARAPTRGREASSEESNRRRGPCFKLVSSPSAN